MTRLGPALLFSMFLVTAGPTNVFAQAGESELAPPTDPSEDRAASFRVVDGAVSEDVPGGALLVGAYGTVLVLLLGYVLWLGSLQAGANREIARLRTALETSGGPGKPVIAAKRTKDDTTKGAEADAAKSTDGAGSDAAE